VLDRIAAEQPAAEQLEVWFLDEARVGQKGRMTRRWFLRGQGLRMPSSARLAQMLAQLARAAPDARVALVHERVVIGVQGDRVIVHAPPPPPFECTWHGERALALPHGTLGFDPQARPRELRRRVGIVLQSSGIYSQVRVGEVVAHFAGFYPHPRDVDEVIELVGLSDKRDERARRLSGGQRRRLDLALALIGDPELIFLDEPTTGFDPAARRTAWQTIRSLKDLGKTVLLTTHYLDEAQELADRVAIIKGGQILAEGSPAELGVGAGSRYRVAYVEQGEPVIQQTDDPTSLLHALTADALARGERLEGLSVTRPSLEEIYLELTADG